ncbi:MAG: Na+/H+ antiporter subunit E [Candidatus Omnitrophota bacterium]|nr:Na+/H+ antiporter subunit E [Candidatus Omnitrophota bacterium]
MRSRIASFILTYVVWLLLSWPPDWQHLVIGVFVSAFVALLTGDLFLARLGLLADPRRLVWALYFIPVFIWECIKANLDVAYRILHPGLPIHPGIVKVKTSLKSEIALTCLANSVTLTPGTMTVDIDSENGFLYIHWINVGATDVETASKIIISRFERILKGVFE